MWKYFASLFLCIIFSLQVLPVQAQRACAGVMGYQDLPYWRANLVFTGVVEKFTIDEQAALTAKQNRVTHTYIPFYNQVRFAVEKEYRGTVGKNVEIISSFNFEEGKKYFVYAIDGKDGKIYQLDNRECGMTPILLENAKDDVDYAEEIAAGKSGTRIFGSVYEDFQRVGIQRQNLPIANVEVTIKNEKHSFTTKTDEKGKYIFKNIPTGEYKISASTPEGLHEKTFKNDFYFYERGLKPNIVAIGESIAGIPMMIMMNGSTEKPQPYYRHSDSYTFGFTSLSSIEGKAVDYDGKVPQQQYIWLIPKINGKIDLDGSIQNVWINPSDGKFIFEAVPRGEYIIVINRNNCHSNYHPEYTRNFFPGVSDLNDAEVITVGENQNIITKEFRLSPTLKERWFSGVVLTTDKKPLANVNVFLITPSSKYPNECFSVNIETKTDEFGRFKLKGYESYDYKIRAYIQPTEQSSSRSFSNTLELSTSGSVENIELIVD